MWLRDPVDYWIRRQLLILTIKKVEVAIAMAILTAQQIIDAQDITETTIPIPEWGGEVVVRSVSYRRLSSMKNYARKMQEAGQEVDEDYVEKEMVRIGLVNPEMTADQVEKMWDKSSVALMKILKAVMGVSNADEDSQKEAEKSLPDRPE